MTPGRLLVGGFLLVTVMMALRRLVESGAPTLGARLKGALKECASMAFAFLMAWMIAGAIVTPVLGLVAGVFGYERRSEIDERQHGKLERIVELDLELAAPAIEGDPKARRKQESRKAEAEKERARVWKRFVKGNGSSPLPHWITQVEEYVLAGVPVIFIASICLGSFWQRGAAPGLVARAPRPSPR